MAIFPERYVIDWHFCRFVVTYDLDACDLYDRPSDPFLERDREISDRLIFASGFSDLSLHFFGFFSEFFCDGTELSSFVSKLIGLVFRGLDFFFETGIFSVLGLHLALDFCESIIVISDELFDFACEDIEVEDPVSERIEEFCIMRDHEYCPFVVLQELCHMPDPISIEIIGRLIEEEDVRLLDERAREEEASLLSS